MEENETGEGMRPAVIVALPRAEQFPSNASDGLGMPAWTHESHPNRRGNPTEELKQGAQGTAGRTPNSLRLRKGKSLTLTYANPNQLVMPVWGAVLRSSL